MFVFRFEAVPKDGKGTDGGAFVNCWIDAAASMEEAEHIAREYIESEGWTIVQLEDSYLTTRKAFCARNPDAVDAFDQAEADGAYYRFHTWPSTQ